GVAAGHRGGANPRRARERLCHAGRRACRGAARRRDLYYSASRRVVVESAARDRLPAIYTLREFAHEGGLMSYGANHVDAHRRAAAHVDKILKGAKPADILVEQPREFDFVINLKTAQALGLTIPEHVLLQATEVIQ